MHVPFQRSARTEPDDEAESNRATDSALAVRLVEGARAGLMATLTMTVFRLPLSQSLPPTAHFWAKFVSGGDPDDHPLAALALHVLYGVGGGVAFGLLVPVDARPASESGPRESTAVGEGRARAPDADSRDAASDADSRTATSDADSRETARRERTGLAWGALYGLALSVFGHRVVLERLLDLDLEPDERFVFHASHLVYGLSLGTWFGSRTSDDQ